MVLRLMVYMRRRDGSQNVVLYENKRWISKCWFAYEKEVSLKTLVCMKTRDGSQNVGLHENKKWFSEC